VLTTRLAAGTLRFHIRTLWADKPPGFLIAPRNAYRRLAMHPTLQHHIGMSHIDDLLREAERHRSARAVTEQRTTPRRAHQL
jgi:hypothetical protein